MSEPFSALNSLVTGQNTRNLVNKVDSSLANNGHKSIIHAYLQPWTCSKSLSKAGNFRDPIRDRKPHYREKICSSSESNGAIYYRRTVTTRRKLKSDVRDCRGLAVHQA
jgi:hypothetical protein